MFLPKYLIFGFLLLGLCHFEFSCYYDEVGALVVAADSKGSGSRFNIKIVEGLPKKKNTYTHSSTPVKPTPSRAPHPLPPLTPLGYLSLDGKCFAENIGRYEYQICPFRNVTQLDKQTTWNPFYGLLGIWNKWENDGSADSHFRVQEYTDGTSCGNNINRKVRVNFECNERYGISKVEEPRTCDYTMIFALPEACNITLPDSVLQNTSSSDSEVEVSVALNNDEDEKGDFSDFIGTEISTTSQECNEQEGLHVVGGTPQCDNAAVDDFEDVGENAAIGIAKVYTLIPQFHVDSYSDHDVQTRWSSFSQAQLIKVTADGDCGYSSVSYALKELYNKEEIPSGPDLRKLVSLNPLKPPNLSQSNFENAQKRSRNNEWVENEELSILSYLYGTCIVVYKPEASHAYDRWSIIMPGVSECPQEKTIYLRLKNMHFDVLVNLVKAVNDNI